MKQAGLLLALHLGALGDFLLALPALALLAEGRELEVWGPSPARLRLALAPRGPVRRVGILPHELFAAAGSDPELDRRLASFEKVIAFVRDDDGPLAARVRALGGENLPPFPEGSAAHAADFLVAEVRRRGLVRARGGASGDLSTSSLPCFPVLEATADDRAAARALLASHGVSPGPIVVHPGSGGRKKRWAAAGFADSARQVQRALAARGESRDVVTLLGPAELDGPPDRGQRLEGVARAVLLDPPLETLLGILSGASLFLGNDGGVTHLAAAAGAPVVAVFGPSDARVWAPRGRAPVSVVGAPEGDLARLGSAPVAEAALDVLARSRTGAHENRMTP